jgi:hypothetical protein
MQAVFNRNTYVCTLVLLYSPEIQIIISIIKLVAVFEIEFFSFFLCFR